ncbi:MAG: hypothetical protein ABSF84_06320 [Acidimicrobiales bacterium]|jgi:hypothetical protein
MEHDPRYAQNWCRDPYGVHEARWFSNGIPTALVRDGGVESQDRPPEREIGRRFGLVPIGSPDPVRAGNPHRAPSRSDVPTG